MAKKVNERDYERERVEEGAKDVVEVEIEEEEEEEKLVEERKKEKMKER